MGNVLIYVHYITVFEIVNDIIMLTLLRKDTQGSLAYNTIFQLFTHKAIENKQLCLHNIMKQVCKTSILFKNHFS